MALRGLMMTADGKRRVHQVNVDGVEKLRVEALGRSPGISGKARPVWYHLADVRTPQEAARHVDLSTLREV